MSAFKDVLRSATATRCRCQLTQVKSQAELAHLGGGCTMPWFACPTLSKYRRLLPQTPLEAVEDAPTKAADAPKPALYDPFASQLRG